MPTTGFWNKRFGQKEYIYGEEPNEYFRAKLQNLQPGSILVPADGEGRNGVFAAKQGWAVCSFDPSESGRKKALQLAEKNGVAIDYQIFGVEDAEYPESSFDAMALIFAHFSDKVRREYHQKLSRFLKPGGVVILEAYSKNQLKNQEIKGRIGGPKNAEMLYTVEEIKKDFDGFNFKELSEEVYNLNEGNYHRGLGNVVRVLAIKK